MNFKKPLNIAIAALLTASIGASASDDIPSESTSAFSNDMLNSLITASTLEEALQTDSEPSETISATSSELSRLIKEETKLERIVADRNQDEFFSLFAEEEVTIGIISDLATLKGQSLGIRRILGMKVKTLDPKQQTIMRIFETIASEMQSNINVMTAPYFDIQPMLLGEMVFSSGLDCKVEKNEHLGKLSIIYNCGDESNGYLVDVEGGEFKVVKLISNKISSAGTTLEELATMVKAAPAA